MTQTIVFSPTHSTYSAVVIRPPELDSSTAKTAMFDSRALYRRGFRRVPNKVLLWHVIAD